MNVTNVQWANWLHDGEGNVALVDGSAHQVTTHGLRSLLTATGPTNRLIIP
jgi:prepilin-type processing-associated H-X9-DG protein